MRRQLDWCLVLGTFYVYRIDGISDFYVVDLHFDYACISVINITWKLEATANWRQLQQYTNIVAVQPFKVKIEDKVT